MTKFWWGLQPDEKIWGTFKNYQDRKFAAWPSHMKCRKRTLMEWRLSRLERVSPYLGMMRKGHIHMTSEDCVRMIKCWLISWWHFHCRGLRSLPRWRNWQKKGEYILRRRKGLSPGEKLLVWRKIWHKKGDCCSPGEETTHSRDIQ